jgi:hypothetical protein
LPCPSDRRAPGPLISSRREGPGHSTLPGDWRAFLRVQFYEYLTAYTRRHNRYRLRSGDVVLSIDLPSEVACWSCIVAKPTAATTHATNAHMPSVMGPARLVLLDEMPI